MRNSTRARARKRFTAVTAIVCVLSVLIGSFSFFTDRETKSATAVAGNMDLVFYDVSASKTGTNGITSNNEFAQDGSWENALVEDGGIINPGDFFDMSYKFANEGNKSMDVRQQLVLTSNVEMTPGAEEYKLTITGGNGLVSSAPNGTLSQDGLTITYDLEDIVLNGTGPGAEIEDGITSNEVKYTIRLTFSEDAGNDFMNSITSVTMNAQAKQHRNTTDADWAEWGDVSSEYEQIGGTSGSPGTDSPIKFGEIYGIDMGGGMAGTLVAYENGSAIVQVYNNGTLANRMSAPAGYLTYSGTQVIAEGLEFATVSVDGNSIDASGSIGGVFTLGSPFDTPIHFGETYVAYPEEGQVATVVLQPDGSGSMKAYQNGTYMGGYDFPAEALTFTETHILDGETEFATISADGKTIDSTGYLGFAFTLDPNYVEPEVEVDENAGLYETGTDNMIATWQELLADGTVHVEDGVVYTNCNVSEFQNDSATALAGDLVLPADGTVTQIGNYNAASGTGNIAFAMCDKLTGIVIPDSVTSISENAFLFCSALTSANIPDTVTNFGAGVFGGCYNLTSVSLPSGLTSIPDFTFQECTRLTAISIPSGVTSIGRYAFANCDGLSTVSLPSGVTTIAEYAFDDCDGLTGQLVIPEDVTIIGERAFGYCENLTSINLPSGLISIGDQAFKDCRNLACDLILPSTLTSIGEEAFKYCHWLTGDVVIPSGVTVINQGVFCDTNIESVTIHAGVTSIGYSAFAGTNIDNVYFTGTAEQWNGITIDASNECLTDANITYNYVP